MRGQKKIIISGYYGFNNSGDDAILRAVVKDLQEANRNIQITALSRNPLNTEKIYGIRAVNRFSIFDVIKEIYNSDMLISGGGSLLQDITSTRSIIYYITIMYIAKLLHKPVMVYANGIGPINKSVNRFLTRRILNRVDLITLRDYNSRETLEEIQVKNKNIFVTSDPVFSLQPSDEKRIEEIFPSSLNK